MDVLLIVYPKNDRSTFCTWIDVTSVDPQGARRGSHHRRRVMVSDAAAMLFPWRCHGLIAATISSPSRCHGRKFSIPLVHGPRRISWCCWARRHHSPLDQGDVFNWRTDHDRRLIARRAHAIIYAFLMDLTTSPA